MHLSQRNTVLATTATALVRAALREPADRTEERFP
jgi:hypothetical protein